MWAEWHVYKRMFGQDEGFLLSSVKELKKHEKLANRRFAKLQEKREKALTEKESAALLAKQDEVSEELVSLHEIIEDALDAIKLIRCGGVPH
jgi:hypothetical protein